MSSEFIKKIERLIVKDNLEEAITLLQESNEWIPESAKEDILALSGQLRNLRQQEMRGIVSHENALLEINKIRNALIQFIQVYSKTPQEQAKVALRKKMKWLTPLMVYLVVSGAAIWWLFLPQPNFRIEADLLVERVSFKYLEGPTDFAEGEVHACFWQNFKSLELEADQVLIDKDGDGSRETQSPPTSNIIIKADENIPGVGVRFGGARLERLHLQPNALLTIAQSKNTTSSTQITIQQAEELKSEWTFQDSMDMQVEMVEIEGIPNLSTVYTPTNLRVYPPKEKAREMKIRAFTGTSNLEMQFDKDYKIEGKNLLMAEPSFYQPLESVAVPTILGGSIQIGVLDKVPLKTIDISEGQALDIFSDQNFSLQKISFEKNGINIHFNGEVQKVETGRNHDSRNPSRIEWLWHSQKLLVLAIGFVLLGLAVFLLLGTWKGVFKK